MEDTYSKELKRKIYNKRNWPSLKRPDFLQELDNVAKIAYQKDSVEGYLAADLIYHQLCE